MKVRGERLRNFDVFLINAKDLSIFGSDDLYIFCLHNKCFKAFVMLETVFLMPIHIQAFLLFTSSFKNGGHFWRK